MDSCENGLDTLLLPIGRILSNERVSFQGPVQPSPQILNTKNTHNKSKGVSPRLIAYRNGRTLLRFLPNY
jgi:hypothetical protein